MRDVSPGRGWPTRPELNRSWNSPWALSSTNPSRARREHDGVDHRHDAALGRREDQALELIDDTPRHLRVAHAGCPGVLAHRGDVPVAADDEVHGDFAGQPGVATEPFLVTQS